MINVKRGIDVSTHQKNIDWKKVKRSGIDFAILRVGYATIIDNEFFKNVEGCLDNNVEIRGIYLFSYALNPAQAKVEADFCIDQLNQTGVLNDSIVFFDLEYDSIRYAKDKGVILDKELCEANTVAFCEQVKSRGFKPGVYCNIDYYKHMYSKEILGKYVLWLADWTGKLDYECEYHQYSSSGKVPGINGNVDMNYFIEEVTKPITKLTMDELAVSIMKGEWGHGKERKNKVYAAGYNYKKVQKYINKIDKIGNEVVQGLWGNGEERKEKLSEAGYNYDTIQYWVNQIIE